MSARQELAERFAQFIRTHNLDRPYGGEVFREKNYYVVLFADIAGGTGVLDGVVKVYGDRFIQVSYMTQYRALPHKDAPVFESETNAFDFLNKAFVLRDFDAALAIPVKSK